MVIHGQECNSTEVVHCRARRRIVARMLAALMLRACKMLYQPRVAVAAVTVMDPILMGSWREGTPSQSDFHCVS